MIPLVLGTYDAYPFFTGTAAAAENVPPMTISLGGHIYPIDLRNYRASSQETLRDGAVVQAETSDSLFNANGAWSRYRHDWSHGAGQDVADFFEETNERRFSTAFGVNPWSVGELKLEHSVEVAKASVGASVGMMVSNDKLYHWDGINLYYTTDGSSWTTATQPTTPASTIQALTTDGTDLYCATATALVKYLNSAPGTPATFSTPVTGNVTHVRFVGNRLIAGIDNTLKEISSSGTQTTIKAHFQSAFRWNVIFALGSRIYAGGYAGSRSELYVLDTDSSGNLVIGQEAAPFPAGELIYRAESYAGIAILGTSRGARLLTQSGDGTLTYGPLYSEFGAVKCMTFSNEYAYVGVTNHPSGGKGIAALKLDTMVDTLQPAYAYSLYADTASGEVGCLVRFLDKLYFINTGGSIWRETSNYLASGELESGELYFGTVEEKILTEMQVNFEPLTTGQSVKAELLDDNLTVIASGFENGVGTEYLTFQIEGLRIHHATVRITVASSVASTTPVVHFWRLRAYPVPPAVYQWIVPLIIHTRVIVNQGMGQEYSMNVLDEAAQIREWFQNKERILYQEGQRTYRVRVDAFEIQPAEWNDEGSFFQHTMVVRLVSA